PPVSRFNLVKLLRWLAMNWLWTALFVGFGGCTRACFASTGPFDLLKAVGLTAAWVLFVAGIQQLPKGAADMLEIRPREKKGALWRRPKRRWCSAGSRCWRGWCGGRGTS